MHVSQELERVRHSAQQVGSHDGIELPDIQSEHVASVADHKLAAGGFHTLWDHSDARLHDLPLDQRFVRRLPVRLHLVRCLDESVGEVESDHLLEVLRQLESAPSYCTTNIESSPSSFGGKALLGAKSRKVQRLVADERADERSEVFRGSKVELKVLVHSPGTLVHDRAACCCAPDITEGLGTPPSQERSCNAANGDACYQPCRLLLADQAAHATEAATRRLAVAAT
mmetsp:Transcript_6559/g.23230  ORF Transcript_6559/g.23230 Transcript_6559/m.23230 type:complete len:227 (+) Transcript_6559:377-1057(+)